MREAVGRFFLLVVQPFRESPEALNAWRVLDIVADFALLGLPAYIRTAVEKQLSFGVGELIWALFVAALLVTWAGLRLQHRVDSFERPKLTIGFEPDATHVKDDFENVRGVGKTLMRRTIRLHVGTTGDEVDGVRLQLLRFTPQGRQGPIYMREIYDRPPYDQSRLNGYRLDAAAPPQLFDVCSWANPILKGSGVIALHYAVADEPNGVQRLDPNFGIIRYYFEVQAFGKRAKSEASCFSAEVDA